MVNPEKGGPQCSTCGRPKAACSCSPQEKFKTLVEDSNLDSDIKEQFKQATEEYENGPWSVEDHVESISQDGDKITLELETGSSFYYIRDGEVDFSLHKESTEKESSNEIEEGERNMDNAEDFIEKYIENNSELSTKEKELFAEQVKDSKGFWDRNIEEIDSVDVTKGLEKTRVTITDDRGSSTQLDINPIEEQVNTV